MRNALRELFETAVVLVATGSIAYGAWLAWRPAGFMVGGLLILAVGILAKLK